MENLRHSERTLNEGAFELVLACRDGFDREDVVSGRPISLTAMTIRQIERGGIKVVQDSDVIYSRESGIPWIDRVILNPRGSASLHKARQVLLKRIEGFGAIVCVEDDLKAALRLSPVADQVYLLNNSTNDSRLLKRCGIGLPGNIERVNSLTEITDRILERYPQKG